MTTQAPTTEERLSRLEGAYEQVNERLEDLRADVRSLREDMHRGQESLRLEMQRGQESLRLEIRALRNNMILLTGSVWATLAAGLIAIITLQ